ncbi:MAG: adenylate/guanylate cyclase domain-containing protein [Pseudomonadota bacterium]
MKEQGRVAPRFHDSVTIMFTDFQGFTGLAENTEPGQLVQTLDQYFSTFDEIAARRGVEKLKTIGDSYMCAGGLPRSNQTHPVDCCLAALEMQHYLQRMNQQRERLRLQPWKMRVGIHTGLVMAGIVGKRKFTYDIWGDTVNVASRMESTGAAGRVNVSGNTYERVKTLFDSEPRGSIEVKNRHHVEMYFLDRIKPEFSGDPNGCSPNERFGTECEKLLTGYRR